MNRQLPTQFPLRRTFLVFERFLQDIDSPGGHLFLLMGLVAAASVGSAIQVPGSREFGTISLYALVLRLMLPRHLKILSRVMLLVAKLIKLRLAQAHA